MDAVSVRQLQQNLRAVMDKVEQGQTIEVTRRRRVVARLVPPRALPGAVAWPDLEARSRLIFGHQLVSPSPSEQVASDRGTW